MRIIELWRLATALIPVLLCAPVAHAQLNQTFVSSAGNNDNNCSRATPCRTFSGALAKTNTGGVIGVIDTAEYGLVTIDKSISIVADGAVATIAAVPFASIDAVSVDVGGSGLVVLRGLVIQEVGGLSNGLRVIRAGAVHLQDCVIRGFDSAGGSGINVTPSATAEVHVSNCNIVGNRTGISVAPTGSGAAKVVLNDVQLENNATGLRVQGPAEVTVGNSVISGNSNTGIAVVGAGASTRLTNSVVTANNRGLNATGAGALISYGNNLIGGNAVNGAPTATQPLR